MPPAAALPLPLSRPSAAELASPVPAAESTQPTAPHPSPPASQPAAVAEEPVAIAAAAAGVQRGGASVRRPRCERAADTAMPRDEVAAGVAAWVATAAGDACVVKTAHASSPCAAAAAAESAAAAAAESAAAAAESAATAAESTAAAAESAAAGVSTGEVVAGRDVGRAEETEGVSAAEDAARIPGASQDVKPPPRPTRPPPPPPS